MIVALIAGLAAGLLHVVAGPDHLAAVAPLALSENGSRHAPPTRVDGWRAGLQWGFGHTAGVLAIAVLLLMAREQLPVQAISAYSERLVGLALIGVGVWGIWKAGRAVQHHAHPRASFAMGTLHGMAGSSHLFGILPSLAFTSRADSAIYLIGFGSGAIVGMTAFAAGIGALSLRIGGHQQRRYSGLLYASSAVALMVGGFWLVKP
jgi:hypothetical protein